MRWFAVVDGRCGYALDYYPEEAAAYRREHGDDIVGDFATEEAALREVFRCLGQQVENEEGG